MAVVLTSVRVSVYELCEYIRMHGCEAVRCDLSTKASAEMEPSSVYVIGGSVRVICQAVRRSVYSLYDENDCDRELLQ